LTIHGRKKAVQRKPAFVAVKAANAKRNKTAVHRSRAGSFAADLCAKRTGKSQKITEKQARLFYRKFSGFSYARELSLRLPSYRRKQVLFFRLPHRPLGFQRDEIPLAQGSKRPEKHPLGWFSAESGPEGPGT